MKRSKKTKTIAEVNKAEKARIKKIISAIAKKSNIAVGSYGETTFPLEVRVKYRVVKKNMPPVVCCICKTWSDGFSMCTGSCC